LPSCSASLIPRFSTHLIALFQYIAKKSPFFLRDRDQRLSDKQLKVCQAVANLQ